MARQRSGNGLKVFVDRHNPPYKVAGAVLLAVVAAVLSLIFLQFRGDLTDKTQLTMVSSRAGLVVDPGSKVTYNGVEIGRVSRIGMVDVGGTPKAKLTLDVDPRYLEFVPANVDAQIRATTVFGNKYVSFNSPENPTPQRISSRDVIDVSAATTEFNTVFETVTSIAQQVDPIKLNQTLAATAEALTGLGHGFGESLLNGNEILDDLNQLIPQIRYDNQRVADLANVYADASPDLWDGLENAVRSARTFNDHRGEGRPGCWQKITRELWPAPYLVMDTGASIAPYNHMEIPQPLMIDYVWGRQIGEHTINP